MSLIVALAIAGLGGCDMSYRNVEYRVTGTGMRASVTMTNAQGGIEQHNVSPPYTMPLELPFGSKAYVSAQGDEFGDVTCSIVVDGKVFRQSTSSASYGIATCSGIIGSNG